MMILAIDPSISSTGYCIFENNKLIKYGNVPTDKNNFETEDERLNYIGDIFSKLLKEYEIKVVIMENQFVGNNVSTGMILKKLSGVLCRVFKDIDHVIYFTPAQWRKTLGINKSKDKKQSAFEYVNENVKEVHFEKLIKSGKKKNEDIIDSICIGLAYLKGGKNGR